MSRYTSRARDYADECAAGLSRPEAEALSQKLREDGEEAWRAWESENRDEAIAFLHATPPMRLRKKAWLNLEYRSRLALAAYHLGYLGVILLDHSAGGFEGSTYRDATRDAAQIAVWLLDVAKNNVWPWDCKPPFRGWDAPRWSPSF